MGSRLQARMSELSPPRRSQRTFDDEQHVVALLGPTNTGKTHRAIQRLLEFPTGMIGLPLRLLAREVYDRLTAEVGELAVALVTGEEKRIPPSPRYHVCTVEAMPVEKRVAFLAVDEIQLCGDRARGHVFTDRLLHARGLQETMFMGSQTIEPLIRELLPEARIKRLERLSQLRYAGNQRLGSLPPRSALVAFSEADVIELAERVRRRHGGTALVMGALSPRTRNAQVAMYQAGEVGFLVATDAIGMGLNLDIDRVVLCAMRKFDGVEFRPLEAAEVAQIAGRAGRFRKEGRFGPLSGQGEMPGGLVADVENHRFPPLRRLYWRNPELDFSSLEALRHSLLRPAPSSRFLRAEADDDHQALELLARMDEVRAVCHGREGLETLWEVCQIPDFRGLLPQTHAALLAQIYTQLRSERGRLDGDWLRGQIGDLEHTTGPIEQLMTRISHIRTWNYVAFRVGWVDDAEALQHWTRDVEDRLSDALHDRLKERFVDRRAAMLLGGIAGSGERLPEVDDDGAVVLEGEQLGRFRGFDLELLPGIDGDPELRRIAVRSMRSRLQERVESCIEDGHEAFGLDAEGRVLWRGGPLALLLAGDDMLRPRIKMLQHDGIEGGDRSRIERRLTAWSRDLVAQLMEPLRRGEAEKLGPQGRGLAYALEQGLGTVAQRELRSQLRGLSGEDRKRLARLDVRLGATHVYVASMLGPLAVAQRASLAGIWSGMRPLPTPPGGGANSLSWRSQWPVEVATAMGYPVVGALAIRVDLLERAAALVRGKARRGRFDLPEEALGWLGCTREELTSVLVDLGYRRCPGGADRVQFMSRRRRRRRGPRRNP